MSRFMTEDFLLDTEFARRLYHDYAKDQPIFDYHCHLPPQQIAENYRFANLYDIWLKGDHYKWRAMRANGVPEAFCTGDASDREKFDAWARTVPHTIGNPLYHWTHLELRRPFGITDTLLSEKTADSIWDRCNALLAQDDFTARGIMQQMNVKMVGTTDDPLDDLQHHRALAQDGSFGVKVLPSWRPDKAFNIEADGFLGWIEKLESLTDVSVRRFDDLRSALSKRLDYFAEHGCKVSDHALDVVLYAEADDATLDAILAGRRAGKTPDAQAIAQFKTAVLVWLGGEYTRRGWVQQYHIGALRNTNRRQFELLGPDVGFDSINDQPLAEPLAKLLGAQNLHNALPKTILYCLNPRDRFVLAMHQAIKPQHQARNDFDIFADLAERLGYRQQFTEGRDERQWIEHLYQQCATAHARKGIDFPEFAEFWSRGFVEIPEGGKPYIFMEDFRADPVRHPIKTASGKIELFSQTIADYDLADFAGHPEWREPQEGLGAALSEQFPLHMISIQPSDRLHSQLDATPTVQGNKTAGHETLYLHPQDAAARDIADGEVVEVRNARGAMLAGARLTDGLTPGVVIVATGAWFDPGFGAEWQPFDRAGNPNVLTLDIGTSSLTQGPNAMSCLVDIKKHAVCKIA